MFEVNNINEVKSLEKVAKEGDIVLEKESNKTYVRHGSEWVELHANVDSNVQLSLYELNKSVMKQMAALTAEQKDEATVLLNNYNKEKNSQYYMLLCRDKNYYTVFVKAASDNDTQLAQNYTASIFQCFDNIGDIVSITRTEDNCAIEIWAKSDNDAFCYYLFPYDEGVVYFS